MATVFDDPAYPYHIHITANVGEQIDLTFGQIFGAAHATRAWSTAAPMPAGLTVNTTMKEIEGTPTTAVENHTAYFSASGATGRTLSFDILQTTPPEVDPPAADGEHFLAPRLAAFLGRPNDPDTLAQADSHLPIVQTFVEGYTRGNGFDSQGRPVYALQSVIISAAARLAANPEQVSWYAIGDYSERPAVLSGYTLPEIGVLHRYRRRSGSIGLASTTSTGSTGGGTIVPGADLTGYATTEYVDQRLSGLHLDEFASMAYVQNYVAANAPQPDLTPYATRTYVDGKVANIPAPDLSAYASRTYVDNKVAGIPAPDLSGYATKGELASYATDSELQQAIDALPEPTPAPDLTPYATKSYVATELGNAAKDTGTRDVSYLLNTANVSFAAAGGKLMLRRIGNLVLFWGFGIRTTSTGAQNVTAALPAGFKPPLANYNAPILTDGSAAHLGTATLRESAVNNSVTYGLNFNVATLHTYSAFSLTMPAADPWPTTLPGVAA